MRTSSLLWVVLCVGCTSGDSQPASESGTDYEAPFTDDRVLCPGCEIRLQEVALLGHPEDPTSVGANAAGVDCSAGRLSTGEYVVSAVVGGGEIQVYDPEGKVVRLIGRKGEGPGELGTRVRLAVGPKDTLYVLDDGQARLSVFSASGEFVRSFLVPDQVRSFALLNNGDLLFSRTSSGLEGMHFYLYGPQGEERGRFERVALDTREVDDRIVAPANPDGFWTASIWRHEFRRWGGAGSLEHTVTANVEWFPPDGRYVEGMPFSVPTAPVLSYLWDDGHGRIWAFSIVPDASWEPGIPLTPFYEWTRRTFDTIIEVIDLDRGLVVAAGRYDQMFGKVCGSPLLYTANEAEDGDTRLQILEPLLVDSGEVPVTDLR